jgi:hypothetical protein
MCSKLLRCWRLVHDVAMVRQRRVVRGGRWSKLLLDWRAERLRRKHRLD